MDSDDPPLEKAVKEPAERAARLYAERRLSKAGKLGSTQSEALPAAEAAMLDAAGLDIAHAPPPAKHIWPPRRAPSTSTSFSRR